MKDSEDTTSNHNTPEIVRNEHISQSTKDIYSKITNFPDSDELSITIWNPPANLKHEIKEVESVLFEGETKNKNNKDDCEFVERLAGLESNNSKHVRNKGESKDISKIFGTFNNKVFKQISLTKTKSKIMRSKNSHFSKRKYFIDMDIIKSLFCNKEQQINLMSKMMLSSGPINLQFTVGFNSNILQPQQLFTNNKLHELFIKQNLKTNEICIPFPSEIVLQHEHDRNDLNIYHLDHTSNEEKYVLDKTSNENFKGCHISVIDLNISDEFGSNDPSPLNKSENLKESDISGVDLNISDAIGSNDSSPLSKSENVKESDISGIDLYTSDAIGSNDSSLLNKSENLKESDISGVDLNISDAIGSNDSSPLNKSKNVKESDISGVDLNISDAFGCNDSSPLNKSENIKESDISGIDLNTADAFGNNDSSPLNKSEKFKESDISGIDPNISDAFGSNDSSPLNKSENVKESDIRGIDLNISDAIGRNDSSPLNKYENLKESDISGIDPHISDAIGSNDSSPLNISENLKENDISGIDLNISDAIGSNDSSPLNTSENLKENGISGKDLNISDAIGSNDSSPMNKSENLKENDISGIDLNISDAIGSNDSSPLNKSENLKESDISGIDLNISDAIGSNDSSPLNKYENLKESDISGTDLNICDAFCSNDSYPLNKREQTINAISVLNACNLVLKNEKHDLNKEEPMDLESFWNDKEVDQAINDSIEKYEHCTADKCISVTPSTSEKSCQTDMSFFERNSCKRMLEFDDCGSTKKIKLPHKNDAEDELSKVNCIKVAEELLNSEDFSVMNNKDICLSPITHAGSSVMPLIYQVEEIEPDEINDDKTMFDEEESEAGLLNCSGLTCDREIVELDQLVPLPQEETKSNILENDFVSEEEMRLSFFINNQDSWMASRTSKKNTALKYS